MPVLREARARPHMAVGCVARRASGPACDRVTLLALGCLPARLVVAMVAGVAQVLVQLLERLRTEGRLVVT